MQENIRGISGSCIERPSEGTAHFMSNESNENLMRSLLLARELLNLADDGDVNGKDTGCEILSGVLRDCAYEIRGLAESEMIAHKRKGKWGGSPETTCTDLWLSPGFPVKEFGITVARANLSGNKKKDTTAP